jgi:iron(III) transport system ATP-binding protein
MSTITVQCKGVHKAFSETPAVRGIDLAVGHGEILALLGPSGCGKTTTMRLIGGFIRPDAGEVLIGGKLVAADHYFVPPEQRRVGMVFQNYALFPHLNVADNVLYGLRRDKERKARMQEVLELVGLAKLEQRLPHELSGGQQQRVALARALAPRPAVLMLDEPFSGLDAGLRDQVRGDVLQILRKSRTTTILVTHSQEEALLMGDRVAVMNEGMIEQIESPEALYLRPATRFVAEFLGATFFLPGIVQAGGVETEIGFWAQPMTHAVGAPVSVALRMDDVTLSPARDGNARILQTIYRGDSYLYEVMLPSGASIRATSPHTQHYPPDTPVRVGLAPGHPLACFPIAS